MVFADVPPSLQRDNATHNEQHNNGVMVMVFCPDSLIVFCSASTKGIKWRHENFHY